MKPRSAKACLCTVHEWNDYLRGRLNLSASLQAAFQDKTQVHTHMCYSEFNDIIQAVGAMDADVISIETSRSPNGITGRIHQML